ncbi:MAG: glycosyltransferase family 39 protein [Patescibacteria group bacterium]|nr:glycosyltransferase family 39 protein [Patescibacteria group bacterium]
MRRTKTKIKHFNKKILFVTAVISLLFVLGALFRIWQLQIIPPGLQYDEAYNGIDALHSSQTGTYHLFYPDNNGREGLYINAVSIFLEIFGVNNLGIRFASALFGTLTLVGFFFLARELRLSWLASIMGTFMLSFSFWHLNFSRLAYRGIMVPLFLVWIFFFFYRGLRTKKYWYFAASGLLTGLGFHSYISFRVVPLIFLVILAFLIILNAKFFKHYWKKALVFMVSASIAALPLFIYFYNHPGDFTGRSGAVSVLNAPDMSFAQAFSKSLVYHFGAFFVHGDPNQRHNHNAFPLLPAAWAILFALGFIISLKEIVLTIVGKFKKTRSCRLCHASILGQSIFWIMLIPGVMSIEGIPHSLRIIGVIPGVFLIAAIPFEYILKMHNKLRQSKYLSYKPWRWTILKISIGGLIATIVLAGASQIYLYFGVWAKEPRTAESFERELFDLGKTIYEIELKDNNFLIVASEVGIFNDHKSTSLKTTEFTGQPNVEHYYAYHPFEGLVKIHCEDSQIVFQKSDSWLRGRYKEECPDLTFEQYTPNNGIYSFWILR